MAINKSDIKLLASERLTDFSDGGGSMTGNEVISGELNNLFPDISRLDRTYGRVSLRKCFPAVMTDNQDMYYGSHAVITDPPDDDNVHVTMFTNHDFDDIRSEARNKIESYLSISGETLLRPMNDQLRGQRAINCFQPVGNSPPEVGTTIVLRNIGTGDTQYVRITKVDSDKPTYNNGATTFTVEVFTIELSAALEYDFPGIEPTPTTTRASTRIHTTIVADSSKYYGVSKVNQAISQGEFNIWVDSIYNQLVPTSQIESPVVDQYMGGDTFTFYPKGAVGSLTWSGTRNQSTNVIHLPDGVMPGSLSVVIGAYSFIDLFGRLSPVDTDGGYTGTVDYASGQIVINKSSWSEYISITATPACPVSESYMSMEHQVTVETRSYNYVPNLNDPLPKPGSIVVDYMAQGKWYKLKDDGRGVFRAVEENTGTGTIDYVSGSCVITLGALPDVGSSIIVSWGVGITVADESGIVTGNEFEITHTIGTDSPIFPGSVTITWNDGVERTLTDQGDGSFLGDGTGSLLYGNGDLRIRPNPIPGKDTTITINYDKTVEGNHMESITDITMSGTSSEFTLLGRPVMEKTLVIDFDITYKASHNTDTGVSVYRSRHMYVTDDGLGRLFRATRWGEPYENATQIGMIDYATGQVSLTTVQDFTYIVSYRQKKKKWYGSAYWVTVQRQETAPSVAPSVINCSYTGGTTTPATSNFSETIGTVEPKLYLLPNQQANTIVPNSVVFTLDGNTYYDVGNGDVYKDKDPQTGVGTFVGNISYSTSLLTLATSFSIANPTITVNKMLTKDYSIGVETFNFRTPSAPIRDGSFSCRVNDKNGQLYTAISTSLGVISASGIEGTIDTALGIVRLKFGEYVPAAGNELEEWYDESLVVGANVWKPMDIIPETALYNAVYYSTLPLDASIVGIEPIRLPTDGRVPIFKSGDVVVLHHTDSEPIGTGPFSDAQEITLNRGVLSIVDLYDYEGNLIPDDGSVYTVDLDTGVITVVSGTLMDSYTNGNTENVVANHRIEDMLLLSEAQINGFLSTVGPIVHDYPATGAQLSTALIFGDLAARVIRLFYESTWDGVWRDNRDGSSTTSKYDTLNYPFIVENNGCADQRWALKFTSRTTVDVIGETLGEILADANIENEIKPTNPATGTPYFRILNTGWGTGWSTGNVIRFDTTSANYPVWLARTTMQGSEEEPTDNFVMQIRGDAN